MADERYSRQILAFGEEGQRKIEASAVAIAGLGGLGSHVAQSLAYLGVGTSWLIDDDRVDRSNLNRLVGAFPPDAEAKALKVDVAARHIQQINPAARVIPIAKNIRTREALDALIQCPLVFGCVDNDGARLVLSELTAAYGATLIDAASEIIPDPERGVDFGGRVVVAQASEFCLDCANEIDREVAKQELESAGARAVRRAHGYGIGEQEKSPAVISLNGIVANLAVTEFLALTTGIREVHRYVVYYGRRSKTVVRTNERRDDCFICGALAGTREHANIHRYIARDSL